MRCPLLSICAIHVNMPEACYQVMFRDFITCPMFAKFKMQYQIQTGKRLDMTKEDGYYIGGKYEC